MPARILFSDVDGVLSPTDSIEYTHDPGDLFQEIGMSRKRLELVKDVLKRADAKLVVHSTMRLVSDARATLDRAGLGVYLHRHWRTPVWSKRGGNRRGHEIKMWLDKHPTITEYAIVDDYADMLKSQQSRFVHTNGRLGITEWERDKLLNIFDIKTSQESTTI